MCVCVCVCVVVVGGSCFRVFERKLGWLWFLGLQLAPSRGEGSMPVGLGCSAPQLERGITQRAVPPMRYGHKGSSARDTGTMPSCIDGSGDNVGALGMCVCE